MQIVTTWNKEASVVKNKDIIITNYSLIKQKKAKITCLCDFCFLFFFCFLLFAIGRRLRSHFKNSCFVFYRCFQTPENNKSLLPRGLGLSSVFSCVETPVKHLHSLFKYYVINFSIRSFRFQRCCEDNVDAIINNVDIVVFWFILFRFVFLLVFFPLWQKFYRKIWRTKIVIWLSFAILSIT